IVLDLSLKTPQLSDSVAIVITEACKGVGTTFHTKARPIVQTMLQWTRDNNSKDLPPSSIPDEDTTSYTLMVNVFKRLLLTCQSSIPVLLANFGDLLLQNLPPVGAVDEWVQLLEVLGSVGKAYTPNTPGQQQ
ncbi:U3 snoRNP protein, partial [Perkinsus olseni]